jgi:DNA repair protein RadD
MRPTPRQYQLDVIDGVRAHVAAGRRRVVVQMPTGAGKTLTAGELFRRGLEKGSRCLFIADRRNLVSQTAQKFREYGLSVGEIMAGVDPTGAPVQVASKDTLLARCVRTDRARLPPADIVVEDECRGVMAREYQHLIAAWPKAVHVGLDATPVRDDGLGLGDVYDAIVCSPQTADLVRDGYLAPVRCFAPQDRKRRGKRKVCGDPVQHWKKYAEGRPTVAFCSRVEQSLAVVAAYNRAGIPAEHIDQRTSDEERDAVFARLEKGRTLVVSNVGIVCYGTDVPCLSCCQLLCLCEGYASYIQRVGRVRRMHPGKADCVVLDHADAVMDHGLPDDPVTWTLSRSETVDQRNKKDRKEGKRAQPVVCPSCGCVYAPSAAGGLVCPECGTKLPRKMVPPKLKAQLLTEVENALSDEERRARRVAHWHSCLAVMANKGQTCAAAAGMFRTRYPEGPTPDLPNYPQGWQWREPVAQAFPQYLGGGRRARA